MKIDRRVSDLQASRLTPAGDPEAWTVRVGDGWSLRRELDLDRVIAARGGQARARSPWWWRLFGR